jgi:N-acetylmuramoyl-L-alanine amidase
MLGRFAKTPMTTIWKGSPNFYPGRPWGNPNCLVIHTMVGSIESTDSWFANPLSQVSAHYGVDLEGNIHAYVRTFDSAWANGVLEQGNCWGGGWPSNPNYWTVSIETEDLGNPAQEVTDAQYSSVRTLARTMIARHGIEWLCGHNNISPGSRPNCPGRRWWESGRMQQLADDTGLFLLC